MKYILLTLVCLVLIGGFYVSSGFAATVAVVGDHTSFHVGDVATFEITLDPETEVLNAVDVALEFPTTLLSFKSGTVKDSIISIWLEKPTFDGSQRLHFSGITPGGITTKGLLLHVEFSVIAEGQGLLSFVDTEALLHDGVGTKAALNVRNAHIAVLPGTSSLKAHTRYDDEAPELFTPFVTYDPDVYDGAAYLVFETQDKLSGIAYYEVKEGRFARYHRVTSPYRIMHQALDRTLYIRAVDQAGNEQVSIIYPQNKLTERQHMLQVLSILTVCVLTVFLGGMYMQRRRLRLRSL